MSIPVHGGAVNTLLSPRAAAWVRDAAVQALSWLIPVDCAGCGQPDSPLCGQCERAVRSGGVRHRTLAGLAVVSAMDYAGPVVGVMRSLKAEGRTGLARPLGGALRGAMEGTDTVVGALVPAIAAGAVIPVAIPSSSAALRRRGYGVVELIVWEAGLHCLPALRSVGSGVDQRALGRAARERNTQGMFAVRSVPLRPVVLIDDVVTTGATLRAATDALRAAGATVIGAVTVASTPLLWSRDTQG